MDSTLPEGAAPSAAFFDHIRDAPFGGRMSQPQVDGTNIILAEWARLGDGDNRKLAYVLATAFHETARTMQPIREFGQGVGRTYGKIDVTGKAPFGRGFVQLTWREVYQRADRELGLNGKLAANYDLALEPDIAAEIIVRGMLEGWFTGRKLGNYITSTACDYLDARRVINGTDQATMISLYAKSFAAGLAA